MQQAVKWTDSARAELDSYFTRMADTFRADGADPDEVKEDVRQHIIEACLDLNIILVSQDDVKRFLRRMDLPGTELDFRVKQVSFETLEPVNPLKLKHPALLMLVGVVLPLVCLGLQALFQADGDRTFDAAPTWLHVLLIGLLPVWSLTRLFHQQAISNDRLRALLVFTGLIVGITSFYSLLFIPFTLIGLMLIIVWGIGLLLLAPLLTFWLSVQVGWLPLRRAALDQGVKPLRFALAGFVLAWGVLIGVELPQSMTQFGLMRATHINPRIQQSGLDWLRRYGDRDKLLEACYESRRDLTNLPGLLLAYNATPEEARDVFYRVTGRTFNTFPVPKMGFRSRWNPDDEFFFDEDQGSDMVGGRLKNLDLSASRLDASVDAQAALGYLEWTMEFSNTSSATGSGSQRPSQKEARALIQLPPGGVVSRLTLWIDGQPREAAFGGTSQVREAYESVVKVQRDPVLVTSKGPDQILVQCYPVIPGKPMKIRLGISYPLQLASLSQGQMLLPRLLERNFSLPDQLRHHVWVEAHTPLQAANQELKATIATVKSKPVHALRGELSSEQLADADWIEIPRQAGQLSSWTQDPIDPKRLIVQTIESQPAQSASPFVLVIDGSDSLQSHREQILAGLQKLPEPLAVVFATDFEPQLHQNLSRVQLSDLLKRFDFKGGRDNQAALSQGWDLAEAKNARLLWLTGPQALLLSSDSELSQRWERRPDGPALDVIQLEAGPNQILNGLSDFAPIRVFSARPNRTSAFEQYANEQSGQLPRFERRREIRTAGARMSGIPETSSHLARLWALETATNQIRQGKRDEALKLAARYHLVTPVSAAVVLENEQQFRDAGLKPVSQLEVPTVPEPETWLLLLTLLLVLIALKLRRKAPVQI